MNLILITHSALYSEGEKTRKKYVRLEFKKRIACLASLTRTASPALMHIDFVVFTKYPPNDEQN